MDKKVSVNSTLIQSYNTELKAEFEFRNENLGVRRSTLCITFFTFYSN